MNEPLHYVRRLFDKLDEVTSDEPIQNNVWRNTRSRDGLYSIYNTQSGETPWGVDGARSNGGRDDSSRTWATDAATETFDCEDPRTCPTCSPVEPGH